MNQDAVTGFDVVLGWLDGSVFALATGKDPSPKGFAAIASRERANRRMVYCPDRRDCDADRLPPIIMTPVAPRRRLPQIRPVCHRH